jgi:hypothetical protein
MSFFDKIKACGQNSTSYQFIDPTKHTPLSTLNTAWVFTNVREFLLPFIKRGWLTNSPGPSLRDNGFSEWFADRVDLIQQQPSGIELSSQFQLTGGTQSRFRTKDTGETAWSWRQDSRFCLTIDTFYDKATLGQFEWSNAFQSDNDNGAIGPAGKFGKDDRRLMWASFGDHNMGNVWQTYHDSKVKYQRLKKVKKQVDPQGVFTPNAFCVGVKASMEFKHDEEIVLPSDGDAAPKQLAARATSHFARTGRVVKHGGHHHEGDHHHHHEGDHHHHHEGAHHEGAHHEGAHHEAAQQ